MDRAVIDALLPLITPTTKNRSCRSINPPFAAGPSHWLGGPDGRC